MQNFWTYNDLFSTHVPSAFQLTLGEGSTPIYSMPNAGSNGDNLYAKLEMRNPTGTHKDRSFAYWISFWLWKGAKECAIASSGNSAVSAAAYCQKAAIRLHAFVSEKIAPAYLARLQAFPGVTVYKGKLPRKDAIQFINKHHIPGLFSSKDDLALEGYKTIAFEIVEQIPRRLQHIFIPVSSGATLEGIYEGFRSLARQPGGLSLRWDNPVAVPALYAVQTARVHTIAEEFDKHFQEEQVSRAKAIVDRVAPRRHRIYEIVRNTGGSGYVISQKGLEEAMEKLRAQGLSCGWQSALSYAGFLRWHNAQKEKSAPPQGAQLAQRTSLCLFTD